MLVLTQASLATIDELFRYKKQGFSLEYFTGYTPDQWGIKAHNRPWIEEVGGFAKGQKIIEVGGAYSLLPKYLSEKYDLEAWIGDDFGLHSKETIWTRWGDPRELPNKYPSIKYIFEPFGTFSKEYPDAYFDRIFTVSTLEHIPPQYRLNVFRDMHRCLKPGGLQLHTIDISTDLIKIFISFAVDKIPIVNNITCRGNPEIRGWIKAIRKSGVKIVAPVPSPIPLIKRQILVESPDVVYRFYPPTNAPKPYRPSASLLLVIEKE